jgi:hypothetical protein
MISETQHQLALRGRIGGAAERGVEPLESVISKLGAELANTLFPREVVLACHKPELGQELLRSDLAVTTKRVELGTENVLRAAWPWDGGRGDGRLCRHLQAGHKLSVHLREDLHRLRQLVHEGQLLLVCVCCVTPALHPRPDLGEDGRELPALLRGGERDGELSASCHKTKSV